MKTPTNRFKQALQAGQRQYGAWATLASPEVAELLGHCGYDWLVLDAEHAPNTLPMLLNQLQAVGNTDTHAVVRLRDDDPAMIKQALDIGAQSILIPMVETAEQARHLTQAVDYPPRGIRGVASSVVRASAWGSRDNYLQEAREQICLMVQIETRRGLDNLDEIAAIDGIDALFIGPADLSASLGHPGNPDHPEVRAATRDAAARIQARGKPAGTLAVRPDLADDARAMGMQFIALAVDAAVLAQGAKAILAENAD